MHTVLMQPYIIMMQVLDILKSVKLTMLQTQSFAPRDVVDVLKSLPEEDLQEQLEVSRWHNNKEPGLTQSK